MLGFELSLPGFLNRITVAVFHSVGKYPNLIRELNNIDKYIIAFLGIFFRIVLVIESCPGDFLFGNFLIMSNISLGFEFFTYMRK